MIAFGSRLYGKTFRSPGRLHVSTRFLHVNFFPFVPRSSWVILGEELRNGTRIDAYQLESIVWRSVFLAWCRAALVVFALLAILAFSTQVLLERPSSDIAATGGVLLGIALAYWCTYQFDSTDEAQIVDLCLQSGLPVTALWDSPLR